MFSKGIIMFCASGSRFLCNSCFILNTLFINILKTPLTTSEQCLHCSLSLWSSSPARRPMRFSYCHCFLMQSSCMLPMRVSQEILTQETCSSQGGKEVHAVKCRAGVLTSLWLCNPSGNFLRLLDWVTRCFFFLLGLLLVQPTSRANLVNFHQCTNNSLCSLLGRHVKEVPEW